MSSRVEPLATTCKAVRGCSQIMSAAKGGGGVWKMMTMDDEGGRRCKANADDG